MRHGGRLSVMRRAVLLLVFAAVASATCLWRSFADLRAPRTLQIDVTSVDKTTVTPLLFQQKPGKPVNEPVPAHTAVWNGTHVTITVTLSSLPSDWGWWGGNTTVPRPEPRQSTDAVLYIVAKGPGSVSSGAPQSVAPGKYNIHFVPVEAGPHTVTVRVEYASRKGAVDRSGREQPEAERYVGQYVAGSPFTVDIPQSDDLQPPPSKVCTSTNKAGYWASWTSASQRDVFSPHQDATPICPACKWADGHYKCPSNWGSSQLTSNYPEYHSYEMWRSRDCQYCRYTQASGQKCLQNITVTVVADSVGMQLCTYLQCALSHSPACDLTCAHRNRTLACWVPNSNVVCIAADQFISNNQTLGDRGFFAVEHYTDKELAANMRAILTERLHGSPSTVEHVLLLAIGLHDAAYGRVTKEHLIPAVQRFVAAVRAVQLFDRLIWMPATAVHPLIAQQAKCDWQHWGHPTCMQQKHQHFTPANVELTNVFIRSALSSLPGADAPVDVLDAWQLTQVREDAHRRQADMVHWCDEPLREITQMLLHMLCGC
eukprot:jgi/Chlat1/5181/Chrsp33S05165